MRAVRVNEGAIEVVDVPRPQGDGVRVRVRSAGVCGSDIHMLGIGFPFAGTVGHELAGETDDGTPVAIEPIVPCGQCGPCASGAYHLCKTGPAMVIGVGRDGGMADEILVPERCLVPIARGVAMRDACLVEPLAIAVHGIAKVGVRANQRVAVIGAGSVGLCAVAALCATGAEVGLAARHDHQKEAGARLGARELSGEYDIVVDCAGNKASLRQALELARPQARLLLLASYWGGMEMPGQLLAMKEVEVVPSMMYCRHGAGRDVDVAAALLANEPEIARTLISHRFPLDAAAEAFATASQRASAGAIKVVLEP